MPPLNITYLSFGRPDLRKTLEQTFLGQFATQHPAIAQGITALRVKNAAVPTGGPAPWGGHLNQVLQGLLNAGHIPPALQTSIQNYNINPANLAHSDQARLGALHILKSFRQREWIDFLQQQTIPWINAQLAADQACVVALPEFYFTDILDNPVHIAPQGHRRSWHGNTTNILYYPEEHNNTPFTRPFYADVFQEFTSAASPFALYTAANPNVALIAGTIVWKEINATDHTDEKCVNTLVTFHQGQCVFLWDKRFTSSIDGIKGEWWRRVSGRVHDKTPAPGRILSPFQLGLQNPVTHASLYTLNAAHLPEPYFTLALAAPPGGTAPNQPAYTMKVDICLDHNMDQTRGGSLPLPPTRNPTGAPPPRQTAPSGIVPDISVLIAAGMPPQDGRIAQEAPRLAYLRTDLYTRSHSTARLAPPPGTATWRQCRVTQRGIFNVFRL